MGKFIVLEGGEGAGKTVCIDALKASLHAEGFDVLFAREPGGTFLGEGIRSLFLTFFREMSSRTAMFLMSAARSHLIENVLIPARQQGRHVIFDRYIASTFAYQLFGQLGAGLEESFDAIYRSFGPLAIPDLFVYLDVDPRVGCERAKKTETTNVVDEEDPEFHRRVHEGYRGFFYLHPDRVVLIDANLPEEEVKRKVIEVVRSALAQ